jgi:hypothetical protein
LDAVGVDEEEEEEEEEPEDGDEKVLYICWSRAGGGGFELGGARLWSVVLRTLGVVVPLGVVVCASTSGMLGDVLPGGVESAWLDAVPVEDGDDNGGGEDGVIGIHDDSDSGSAAN